MVKIDANVARKVKELIPDCNSFNFQILVCYDNNKYYALEEDFNAIIFACIQKLIEVEQKEAREEAKKIAFEDMDKYIQEGGIAPKENDF